MDTFTPGTWRMRNGEIAQVTKRFVPDPPTHNFLTGTIGEYDPVLWMEDSGHHSAGGYVFPGHAPFDLVGRVDSIV